ncbi:hypothetical protein [Flavobacterium sp. ACN6]|uniref:hypothetical protein n=1 Tax=Flavobacterium sp. ACN6 TaxID=1920426 RepID=UPI000BB2E9C0|nr:hypothetical protein [Flavobacterium sp. ACN6]PBJ15886.1 hypothetical protein BSF42_02900 [Flavobacterium sp. ACN6]
MENLINQENLEEIRTFIENKIADVPGELILLGAVGSLLLSSYLNKNGNTKAASMIGSLAVPIVGIGLAKYKDVLKSQMESLQQPKEEIA